jgi:5'-nucleotidase
MKTILLTNDDGYFSAGIRALQEYLSGKFDVYIVAPDNERSAASMALTINRPLRIQKITEKEYAVDGTPVDCVNVAVQKILPKPPDIVISGLNLGENLSEDIFFSGTVGAAFSGYLYDIPSLAVSLISDKSSHGEGKYNIEDGVKVTGKILREILKFPEIKVVYNVNIPYKNNGKALVTVPGTKRYRPDIIENTDPRGQKYYWIGTGNPTSSGGKGTDVWAVQKGFISLSPLKYDLANHEVMKKIAGKFDEI